MCFGWFGPRTSRNRRSLAKGWNSSNSKNKPRPPWRVGKIHALYPPRGITIRVINNIPRLIGACGYYHLNVYFCQYNTNRRRASEGADRAPSARCARFAACDAKLVESAKEKFGVETPFGGPTSSGMLTLHCPPDQVYALTSFLREQGAEAVAVADLDYVFSRDNPLYAKRVEAGLGG